jgi:hypothetical protein
VSPAKGARCFKRGVFRVASCARARGAFDGAMSGAPFLCTRWEKSASTGCARCVPASAPPNFSSKSEHCLDSSRRRDEHRRLSRAVCGVAPSTPRSESCLLFRGSAHFLEAQPTLESSGQLALARKAYRERASSRARYRSVQVDPSRLGTRREHPFGIPRLEIGLRITGRCARHRFRYATVSP